VLIARSSDGLVEVGLWKTILDVCKQ